MRPRQIAGGGVFRPKYVETKTSTFTDDVDGVQNERMDNNELELKEKEEERL